MDRFIVYYERQIDGLQIKLDGANEARRQADLEAAELRGRLDRRSIWDRLFRRK